SRRLWDHALAARHLVSRQEALASRVAGEIATETSPRENDLLHQFVGEALFSDVFDQRLYAQFMLYSTPYRADVADALGRQLTRSWREPATAARILEALRVLGEAPQRTMIENALLAPTAPAVIRDEAACALGHAGGLTTIASWRAVLNAQLS